MLNDVYGPPVKIPLHTSSAVLRDIGVSVILAVELLNLGNRLTSGFGGNS